MLSIKASTVQVYNCGNPRTRQCGGRLSFQVVRHLSRRCIYVVLYIYSVLFLLFCIVYRKKKSFLFLPKGRAFVTIQNGWNNRISDGCVYAQIRRGLGMHLVTYSNHDTVLFLLIVPIKGGLSEMEFIVSIFINAYTISLFFLNISEILCVFQYIKDGISHSC